MQDLVSTPILVQFEHGAEIEIASVVSCPVQRAVTTLNDTRPRGAPVPARAEETVQNDIIAAVLVEFENGSIPSAAASPCRPVKRPVPAFDEARCRRTRVSSRAGEVVQHDVPAAILVHSKDCSQVVPAAIMSCSVEHRIAAKEQARPRSFPVKTRETVQDGIAASIRHKSIHGT